VFDPPPDLFVAGEAQPHGAMLDFRVPVAVAKAVATAAMKTGVARVHVDPEVVAENARAFIYEGKLGLVA
jgi:malic enzyme